MKEILKGLEEIVREAGARLLQNQQAQVHEKEGIGNYVTEQDLSTQRFLYERIGELLPEARFMGEEDETHDPAGEGLTVIIDPIDGTANFIRGAKYSAISVGVVREGKLLMGVVYNPWTDELYRAAAGEGAFLNDRPIRVSDRPLDQGVAVVGFTAYERDLTDRQFRLFRNLFDACQDLRSLGSAALDICGVACGRWEVFTELRLLPWDYAGAWCILQEAGGILTNVEGEDPGFAGATSILAASALCHEAALRCCKRSK